MYETKVASVETIRDNPLTRIALRDASNLFRGHQITDMKLSPDPYKTHKRNVSTT
jgi:hypothetical protein